MKKKIYKKELSITLDRKLVEMIDSEYGNRSKFIQYCIYEELMKYPEFQEELKKMLL